VAAGADKDMRQRVNRERTSIPQELGCALGERPGDPDHHLI
jgi:hypothetical protein